jgi:hypothetical protein
MIQIDGIKRHVYLKFVEDKYVTEILQASKGQLEYRHATEEISIVKVELTGMGTRRIRIANIPPETPERTVKMALASYGDILSIQEEVWSKAYRYPVHTGVKIAMMKLSKYLPSQMAIGGQRVLISYEGQPATFCGCGGQGHMHQACPKRRKEATKPEAPPPTTWARFLTQGLQEKSNADQEQIDTSTPEETPDKLQLRQPENVVMNSVSEYPQTWPGLDDKEAQKEKNVDHQTRDDVMETDTPTKNTQTNDKKEDTMEPQHTGAAEQDAKDWAQLIQEEEDGCSTMMVEDNTEKSTPRETAPTRGTEKAPGEAV